LENKKLKMALEKSINDITEEDLISLITNSVSESKKLDYKKELLGNNREDKKEFLADVSSFANALGGYIIFGIEEEGGIAKTINGLDALDCDAEKLRLENIIRDGIEPRIFGISINSLQLSNGNFLILVFIPNSWSKPHVVNFSNHWRFYSRNSAGKYQLDYLEVKSLFFVSETTTNKIRDFIQNRISNIIAGETPLEKELVKDSYVILHIIPINAYESKSKYDFNDLMNDPSILKPLHYRSYNHRLNFDGILTYTPSDLISGEFSYLQLFRNGIIEAVNTSLLSTKQNDVFGIPAATLRNEINSTVERVIELYKNFQIQPPFLVFLNLLGVKDYIIFATPYQMWDMRPLDRNNLFIPEALLEDYESNINDKLKYIYDSIWNAAGLKEAYE
ncbi:helix-turn-helix domain-containing protein, partial [Bacteroidota bacterium]